MELRVKFGALNEVWVPPSIVIEGDKGAVSSCVTVSLIQLVSFPASSLNFTYTVAIAFVCPRFHALLVVAYVYHIPPAEHSGVLVMYI